MSNYFVKHVAFGELFINVGWVDIARHDRKQLNIFLSESTGEAGALADLQFVEGAVFDSMNFGRGAHFLCLHVGAVPGH